MAENNDGVIAPAQSGKHLFCFGYGYTAQALAAMLMPHGWTVSGTTTDPDKKKQMQAAGVRGFVFARNEEIIDPVPTFHGVTHILFSIPPGNGGDMVYELHADDILDIPTLEWAGYLSTTAVYGNQDGQWVDETTPPEPTSRRGSLRVKAEQQWMSLAKHDGLPVHIFRLSGIYGYGRNALDAVRTGQARRIEKPNHVFNRIHVEDIARTLIASMNAPNPGAVYNLADDLPSPSHEVITFACNLLGMEAPPVVPFDSAELAPIVRSFYKDNKRVRNDKIKNELGVKLKYPDYRAGLQACFDIEAAAMSFLKLGPNEG